MDSTFIQSFSLVTAVIYAISCFVKPHYNGNWLYQYNLIWWGMTNVAVKTALFRVYSANYRIKTKNVEKYAKTGTKYTQILCFLHACNYLLCFLSFGIECAKHLIVECPLKLVRFVSVFMCQHVPQVWTEESYNFIKLFHAPIRGQFYYNAEGLLHYSAV